MRKTLHVILLLALPILILLAATGLWLTRHRPLPLAAGKLHQQKQRIDALQQALTRTVEKSRKLRRELREMPGFLAAVLQQNATAAPGHFREQLEKAAAASGLQLRSASEIRESKLTEQLHLWELSFTATGGTAELVELCRFLSTRSPRLYWRTLSIRPDNPQAPQHLIISASLTMLSTEEKKE